MWAELLSSVIGGGITGLAGSIVTKVAEHKAKRLEAEIAREKFAHEVAMRKVDSEIMAQEWAARTKVAEVEAAGKEAVADSTAFAAALTMEPKLYSEGLKPTAGQAWALVVLDLARGIVRPALTVYLCAITTMVYIEARNLTNSVTVTPAEATELLRLIVNTVLYLTTSCVLFWFGARNKQAAPKIR